MKKKLFCMIAVVALLVVTSVCLLACGEEEAKNYADGTYQGRSNDFLGDSGGVASGYGEVTITIKDNVIVECDFKLYELDGTLKDATYGQGLSDANRRKAQVAAQSAPRYAAAIVKEGSLKGVDSLSGATYSYREFVEAVRDALKKAEIKD
ncbi:MAG: FMN-binding protein [Clostridia bacterium]|nr:FMN-binding protein [Clostridia bacterium]